ncbi:hypothetical protein HPB49_000934 [Dermacentor silvarum]|uniref:Uncharacterized protein n=1 Tax=Dermacentor silvarum TaxID=543639 RepID=A0ACB8C083_DERSI|nr:hypothetical protein HPB49_000934 [Dermacentor silvarum]
MIRRVRVKPITPGRRVRVIRRGSTYPISDWIKAVSPRRNFLHALPSRREIRNGHTTQDSGRQRIAISLEVKSATSHTQYCNRLRPIVKRVSGNSCCGYQGTREFEAMRLLMPPPENFNTGTPPIPPQLNFSLTRTILSPFFHIQRSYNISG